MSTASEQIRSYQKATQQVRDRLALYARTAWAGMDSYRDSNIDQLVELIVPQMLAGERRMASLTDAYLSELAGNVAIGIDADKVSGTALRGVAAEEVYQRPGKTVWNELSKGKSPDEAIRAGLLRLMSLVATDLQLAKRVQEQATLEAGGYAYYRRVLTGRENCMLCVVASTQRYHTGDLNPIHPGCDCGVAQIGADSDPGQILNADLLAEAHDLVDERFGNYEPSARGVVTADGRTFDYKDIVIREHGEYGPTLTWRTDKFTGPGDLAA